jgi:hypothetical protein
MNTIGMLFENKENKRGSPNRNLHSAQGWDFVSYENWNRENKPFAWIK